MGKTEISWSEYVWNVARGCQRVSPGCGGGAVKGPEGEAGGCYAETMAGRIVRMGGYEWVDGAWREDPKKTQNAAARASADRYRDLVKLNKAGKARWTGKFTLDTGILADPLSWRSPRLVFVNSMSDLFGEGLSNEEIAAVFGVMAACPGSTFQVLTKRAARMAEWFRWIAEEGEELEASVGTMPPATSSATGSACVFHAGEEVLGARASINAYSNAPWPLPNVWLGISAERQEEADERIPHLLDCPAAVRWVSAEPLLGPIDFTKLSAFKSPPWPTPLDGIPYLDALRGFGMRPSPATGVLIETNTAALNWVVFGGESGHGARPCAIEWIRSGVEQCREAGAAAYVKQLGAYVVSEERTADAEDQRALGLSSKWAWRARLKDKKGADMAEWPEDIRVRQWPAGFTPPKSKALPVVEGANA